MGYSPTRSYDLSIAAAATSKLRPAFAERLLYGSASYAKFVFGFMLAGLICMAAYAVWVHTWGAAR
jgi:hypothetical protein